MKLRTTDKFPEDVRRHSNYDVYKLLGMGLGTIPTEQVVLVSAALTGFIAYQSRLNGLETARERERHLNSRLSGASLHSVRWGLTLDNVQEKSGFLYRVKKFLTGSVEGDTTVVVRYENRMLPGSFWKTKTGKSILDSYWVEVEHLRTQRNLDPTIARFKFGSTNYEDIMEFFDILLKIDKRNAIAS